MDGRVWEALHVAHALDRSGDFDLVHNHLDWLPLAFSALSRAPVVTTIHGFSGPAHPARLPAVQVRLRLDLGRRPLPRARLRRDRPPRHRPRRRCRSPPAGGEELVCFGRIHPDKGTARGDRHRARRRAAAGDLRPRAGRALLRRAGRAALDGDRVLYLGSVGPGERAEVLARAACLLHPIAFDEPFGLSVVESMACGTPVVAYPRGSMPEIIDDGVTGFLADGVPAAAAAVERAVRLDRAACRRAARSVSARGAWSTPTSTFYEA